ncbi:MAG TPA: tripartite tricarboxylate transporter substrate binding protein [Burkholderiales bacterium]|nr:tripartite tricarboxylate transporter substrate binding protein [Burkholderiales bacterium]
MRKDLRLRRHCLTASLPHFTGIALLLLTAAMPVSAQPYPARPIRLIVPFPPGTTLDVVGRLVALRAGDRLGQQVVVDNRSGASGTIGVETAARAAPDGYTWGLGTTTTHALAHILNPKLGYDPVRDFAPVALLGETPYFLTTNPAFPASNVREFVAYARANPGKVSYASVGNFSMGHLAGELLKKAGGFEMVHVPYKGSNLALIDLLAGRIQLNVSTIPASLPHVRAGKLRALAVASPQRVATLRDTPTVAESGFPGYEAVLWVGAFVPARTPDAVLARIRRETDAVLHSAEMRDALAEQAFEPGKLEPAAFAARMREDTARWQKVITESGLKPDQ